MTPTASPRLSGVLISWRLSKSGGMGKVYIAATQQLYFICRKFIVTGEPHVGCTVTFVPRPAIAGTKYPQASNAIIDNAKAIRALDLSKYVPAPAVAALSGKERA
jgi:hypothetical protein